MARVIFPSFHYERDAMRAGIVRGAWRFRGMNSAGYRDGARWEQVKRAGEQAVKDWIEQELQGVSVTVVLIGQETASRDWVRYEIQRSCMLKKGIVGVRVHGIPNPPNMPPRYDAPGDNPLDRLGYERDWGWEPLSRIYRTYDYATQDGYNNLGMWIEEAARIAGR